MKLPMLSVLLACVVGTGGIGEPCGPFRARVDDVGVELGSAAPAHTSIADPRTVTLEIAGMTCGGCAIAAPKVLTRLDGVTKAEVSYETRRATVTYDPEKVTVEQLIAAVKKLGYTASVVER